MSSERCLRVDFCTGGQGSLLLLMILLLVMLLLMMLLLMMMKLLRVSTVLGEVQSQGGVHLRALWHQNGCDSSTLGSFGVGWEFCLGRGGGIDLCFDVC